MENKDFAVFILTHGRPDNVKTYATIRSGGYTGKIYLIVDDQDTSIEKYLVNFPNEVIVFNKDEYIKKTDVGNNFGNRSLVVFARNACFDIAKKIGITYFLQLDDDYTNFRYKVPETNNKMFPILNLNLIFSCFLEFYKKSNCASVAFAQGGDFIGGIDNGKLLYRFSKRKCMNSFFCSTMREFDFFGAINEDVNAYITHGSRGVLFFTIPFASLDQVTTQKNKGGLTTEYLLSGTYVKSFYSVMMHPSGVKVNMMKSTNPRLHHSINWGRVTPMIINEKYKK